MNNIEYTVYIYDYGYEYLYKVLHSNDPWELLKETLCYITALRMPVRCRTEHRKINRGEDDEM